MGRTAVMGGTVAMAVQAPKVLRVRTARTARTVRTGRDGRDGSVIAVMVGRVGTEVLFNVVERGSCLVRGGRGGCLTRSGRILVDGVEKDVLLVKKKKA